MLAVSKRQMGQSGRYMSVLSYGAAPIGNLYRPVDERDCQASVHAALDAGLNYFDTAPFYGFGLSESRLGASIASHGSAKPFISTKVGRRLKKTEAATGDTALRYGFASDSPLEPWFDYSYDGVMRSFEESLVRLQTEKIDILYAHDLGRVTHGDQHPALLKQFLGGGYRAMDELKAQGMVDAIGIGANEWEVCLEALNQVPFDCFLLAGRFTLLDQSAGREFLPRCDAEGISVILGGPFNSGILATGVRSAPQGTQFYYNYETAPQAIIERVKKLEIVCSEFNVELAAAALQFPLGSASVCSVLAGLVNAEQVSLAVGLMAKPIEPEFWAALIQKGLLEVDVQFKQVQQ